MAKKMKSTERYFNENHVEITTKVNEGFTQVVVGIGYESEKIAYEMATKKRSYVFPVYCYNEGKFIQYGYGVAG